VSRQGRRVAAFDPESLGGLLATRPDEGISSEPALCEARHHSIQARLYERHRRRRAARDEAAFVDASRHLILGNATRAAIVGGLVRSVNSLRDDLWLRDHQRPRGAWVPRTAPRNGLHLAPQCSGWS
jgi:hypothetical protein